MPHHPLRLLLSLALGAALCACSDEPEVSEAPAAPAVAADEAPKTPPPPKLAEVRTPYERALRALTSGGSFSFEAETTLPDGSQQYANGSSSGQNYAFGLRTLPKPVEADGNWVLQGGRYFREAAAGYDAQSLSPAPVALLVESLLGLPQDESTVAAGEPAGDCSLRRVDLSKVPQLMTRYRKLEACIDEQNAKLLRLESELQSGEKLKASLSAHGEPVQLPKIPVTDWSQEFPRR